MDSWRAGPSEPPPKRKRKREEDDRPLAITCTPCRARKIKCDSTKPTCDNCAKNPHECVYPPKLKPGLRAGTGSDMAKRLEQLEDRVHAYEAQVHEHEARLAQLDRWQSSLLGVPAPQPPTQTTQPQPQISQPQSTRGDTSLSAGLFSPELPTDARALGSFTNASPGNSVGSFLDSQLLPPDDIVRDLIALFFSHIAPWAPIIPPMPTAAPPWSITVYAIVVVTLRLSDDPRIAGTKQQYRQAAKSHVLSHAIESTSIASMQALALLALDLIGSEQGPSSWGILALLTRSAVHLGLITEDDGHGSSNGSTAGYLSRPPAPSLSRTSIIPPPASWQEDESRRRLFWLIFCLDRYACTSTGWDFALPDDGIRRRLPCSDEIWAGQEWYAAPLFETALHRSPPDPRALSPMAYLVEAIELLGRAHTLQSRTVEASDSQEIEYRQDMAGTLTRAAQRWFVEFSAYHWEVNSMTLVIQAIHHATLLKLNAYYAFPALSNGSPVEPYGSTCMASARALAQLTATARDAGFKKTSSPLFIWSTWVAARVLFVNAFLAHKDRPDVDFETILSGLKAQAQYWSLANQYVKLLERAKRKWLQAAGSRDALPDAIHVLLDLRRTAYNAVGAGNGNATPHASPPEVDLSHVPAWALTEVLAGLHDWFDLPAGLFGDGV